jgi:glutamate synthase (NADPH/NADH) large chain/glutamate synthase (ferredoxin)
MSGGIAYVLDDEGKFEGRVNPTMLNQLEEPGEEDRIELRGLIQEHLERTGSEVARRILDDWDEASSKFVKVFPADYKRVLAELEAEGAGEPGKGPETNEVDVIGEPATGVASEKGA